MTIHDLEPNVILVELPAEPHIRDELDAVMEVVQTKGDCDVIIDFSNVNIMTSLSLSGFLQLYKILTTSAHRLVFFNTTSITKDIFKVTCFDGMFEFTDDQAAAMAALQPASLPN